ncbi:3-hydroxybutyryl-CoA dehydrogenase [Paramagnetospirillum kuznetsovii]|uniref:3-hydroxybutyryl-CoA dehydrogenase n=1 Tax=Paramagnetospirillum kuznetsovii TaxID=2053833 RepID=A0A364NZU6_9PROT|nr:3-hydroxyacyl-CoA dehydrogenase family protein [Paramagnetospirillum kuznetsovii]RAU22437.1 3-hydroxybutyryl-CoA dehydrogenase [Paramagnetospirillum kuznetsovii]
MSKNQKIGLVGAGTMGAAIAQGAAVSGFEVILNDRDPAVVDRAMAQIKSSLGRSVEKGKMTAPDAEAALARLTPSSDLADLAPCALVIEAIIENFEAKSALFSALSGLLAPTALMATNTSSLKVDDLAKAVTNPERFLGLHYFFPAAINPLLEIVRGAATSDAVMDTASAFATATGKQAIRCKDAYGFAVNRYFVPYLNEAARLLDEGMAPGDMDRAVMDAFGTAVGPFKLMDISKPVIALHACRTLAVMGAFYQPAPSLVIKGEAGGPWNAEIPATVEPELARTITDRLQGAVLTAMLEALDEKVATPEDMDLGARIGLQWQWQPWAAAVKLGRAGTQALVARYFAGRALPVSLGRLK